MSVYLPLSHAQAAAWFEATYALGRLRTIEGIPEGVQNSNFFVTTSDGQYVLTVFEQVAPSRLAFYIRLLSFLAERGIPCPSPLSNRRGAYIGELAGRAAVLFNLLDGRSTTSPTLAQCAAIGATLADLHGAARFVQGAPEHSRDLHWCAATAAQVMPSLHDDDARLLADEIGHQRNRRPTDLPRGLIHADLFRDNVLFVGTQVSGVLDFYFAGVDDLLFDLAVTVNDWCSLSSGELDGERRDALVNSYAARRPLSRAEEAAWPTLLRAAALRFWLSRLYDGQQQRDGDLIVRRDPDTYRAILRARVGKDSTPAALAGLRRGG